MAGKSEGKKLSERTGILPTGARRELAWIPTQKLQLIRFTEYGYNAADILRME